MSDPIVKDFLQLLDANCREAWDERAAIMEFDGGLQRELAEALALLQVIRQYPQAVLSALI
jgi:hypothetical protein